MPHSVPGSKPIWPMTSMTVGPLAQHHGVVAVEPAGAVGLVGLGEDRGFGRGLGEHEDVARRDRAREVDGQAGDRVAVEEHLHVVAAGAEVHRSAGAVVDLERLVVRDALDVLGEEELGGLSESGSGEAQEQTAALARTERERMKERIIVSPQ